ncbi:hypothetical protein [Thermoactinomyces mirandus]|uniref:Uncharacterized protein n=1 Tax=Thermoactinomyces mirandus TaxID=2756294 RepID=A0A7W1XQ31_9BACL|nr:hypothetical protein [Thermoactinomyces mirandus]MBA4601111.1 hypothetical protein [Thermoactinomyces mirandus]
MIRNIYIYLVLFATLMMTIGGSVGVFMAIADLASPVPYHQTFEQFQQLRLEKRAPDSVGNDQKATLSEDELKKQYDAMVAAERERQMSQAKNSLIKSFGWIVIPLPVFIYYQRQLTGRKNR